MWEPYKKGYKAWLRLERSLSDNSVEAYLRDIDKLTIILGDQQPPENALGCRIKGASPISKWIGELALNPASQARILSGIRSFYKYCSLEQIVRKDPTLLLEGPKQKRALPGLPELFRDRSDHWLHRPEQAGRRKEQGHSR